MNPGPYAVLCADPPWKFSDKLPGEGRGAEKHYETLSVDAIKNFPLPSLEDTALLFLWRVASMQEEALAVGRAWGFVPKTEIVWRKTTGPCKVCHGLGWCAQPHSGEPLVRIWCTECEGRGSKRHFGMGRITRAEHEVCLVFARGKYAPLIKSNSIRSVFDAPFTFEAQATRKHSQKPEVFYDIVEELFHGPYVELFARRQRPGWTCLGNETKPTDTDDADYQSRVFG